MNRLSPASNHLLVEQGQGIDVHQSPMRPAEGRQLVIAAEIFCILLKPMSSK